jgi:HPt (histidine-containing phosphotransfer) domain-containing protein
MQVNNTTQTANTPSSIKNNSEQSDTKFDDIYNQKISELDKEKIVDGPIPPEAIEQMKQKYKDSFTDERYEEILEKLDIKNLSDEDKELFKSIIDDRHISYDEVKDLSYEQMETLKQFTATTEKFDSYEEIAVLHTDFKVERLFQIPLISDNETFNKSVLEMAKKFESDEEVRDFMAMVTGTWNFPNDEPNHIDYDTQDPDIVLRDIIYNLEEKLETTTKVKEVEFYKNAINLYTGLLNTFDKLSGKDMSGVMSDEEYFVDIREDLIEDLMSILRTGLTISEIESIEKLIADINKLIEDSKEQDISEGTIKEMIQKLKSDIEKLQERMGIQSEENPEGDLNSASHSKETEGLSVDMKILKSVVQSLEEELIKIKEKNDDTNFTSTDDELQLRELLQQK